MAAHFLIELLGLNAGSSSGRTADFESANDGSNPSPASRTRADLRFYQTWMVEELKRRPVILLAAEMGLGKTVAVLTALVDLLATGEAKRVLVIAPLKVAENTWPDEIEEWAHTRGLTYSVLIGTREEREAAARQNTQIHIINRENVVWLWEFCRAHWPYDTLVYDEASRLKGGSKRTKPGSKARKDGTFAKGRNISEFGTLSRARPAFRRVIEMSGTPAPNGLKDLWGPSFILDRGERLGTSKTAFMSRWFVQNKYDYSVDPQPWAEAEIMERMSDVMVSLREEDYLTLPPRIDNPVKVTLGPKLMEQYRRFERTLYLEEFDVEALNNGVLTNKLLQFANGSLYVDENVSEPVHDLKLQALESIVEEAAGEPVLVAYSFKFDLDRIRKRYPKAVVLNETKDAIKRWNRGEIQMMIVHPASAGHGLNLQYGGSIGVWYGLTWSYEYYSQFIKRLHRSGQKGDRVWMHHIIAEGTADEDVMRVAQSKGATQDRITEVVRVRLENAA